VFGGLMAILIAAVAFVLLSGEDDEAADGSAAESASGCDEVEAPAPRSLDLGRPGAERPRGESVVFDTSCGSFTVSLDAERAPRTAASFEYLAERGAFDGTTFHRVAPGFVVQGGDPAGDGSGGPGYSVREEPPPDLAYTRGLVAMAKTPVEPAGTSGSQFFIVTAEADAGLPPEYALVGEVTEGFETVLAIEDLGTRGADGPPSRPVVIEEARVAGGGPA
jgi:peptidyl-prolyl cis-trans isomerase B (cyclophilin B)